VPAGTLEFEYKPVELTLIPILARLVRPMTGCPSAVAWLSGWLRQIAASASDLVTARPRAPYSCRSPNISMRMAWSRPPTWTGS
jgi:hypothetical protein